MDLVRSLGHDAIGDGEKGFVWRPVAIAQCVHKRTRQKIECAIKKESKVNTTTYYS